MKTKEELKGEAWKEYDEAWKEYEKRREQAWEKYKKKIREIENEN